MSIIFNELFVTFLENRRYIRKFPDVGVNRR